MRKHANTRRGVLGNKWDINSEGKDKQEDRDVHDVFDGTLQDKGQLYMESRNKLLNSGKCDVGIFVVPHKKKKEE